MMYIPAQPGDDDDDVDQEEEENACIECERRLYIRFNLIAKI